MTPCLPNTRVDLLQEIYSWVDGQNDGQNECRIFWLNGLAGTGKSTIARTVARRCFNQKRLGASFFFSRGGGDVGSADKFVTSIVVQLASSIHTVRRYISGAVTEYSDITSRSLYDQWQQLVLRPLSKLDGKGCCSLYILVVDALDECDGNNNIRIILQLLAEARSLTKVQLRVFLTSRPEVPIRHGFHQISKTEHRNFILHNISPSIVDHDISVYLEHELELIAQERCLGAGWPERNTIRRLVEKSSGLFIWAVTACRFIREGKLLAKSRLATILKSGRTSINTLEAHLNEIYNTVLKEVISPDYTAEEREEIYGMLRHTLGCMVVSLSPLPIYSLSRLLHRPKEDID